MSDALASSAASSPAPFLAIFDHDGVLVDSYDLHQQAWLELGRRTGLPVTREVIHETFGMTNPSIFQRLLGDALAAEEVRNLGDLKEACYRELARPQLALIEGVRGLLDGLSAVGAMLAVGSSAPRANVELTVEVCGLVDRFRAIAALEDIQRGKPDPEVFLVASERAGVPPARSVVFEDAAVGIRAAKAAGMYAVGITTTHPAAVLHEAGADEVLSRFEDLDVRRLLERFA